MQITIKRPENWAKLKKGDFVSLICPASGLPQGDDLDKIGKLLQDKGLDCDCSELKNYNDGEIYLAASDEKRFASFKDAVLDDRSSVIFALKGGYGSGRLGLRILSQLKSFDKLLVGFSDITSLHLILNVCFRLPSLHGPTLRQIVDNRVDEQSVELLFGVLFGNQNQIAHEVFAFNDLAKDFDSQKIPKLIGGNLSLIESSIATPWGVENAGEFCLLIEEVTERGYRIDRALNHLINANCLRQCKVVFIGDVGQGEDVNRALELFAGEVNLPVFRVKNVGHEMQNRAVILGRELVFEK